MITNDSLEAVKDIITPLNAKDFTEMYKNVSNLGTEDITQEDLKTPHLKIVQSNTKDIPNKKEGWFYRSDTKEQIENPIVNLVYVTTVEELDYKKKNMVKKKIYYGFYAGTTEPFKMYVAGWGMEGHRELQTEVAVLKKKIGIPMLALTLQLSTKTQQGVAAEDGTPYDIYKLVFTVLKDENDMPKVEMNPERMSFLVEAVSRFKDISATGAESENDEKQNGSVETPF